ncbi:hypothetical protein PENSPDRAFT_730775 [Peniophora sp. CONT]|nr:hypothetical protein PENSPDRAFT_730775 [Peniophora sp. CONT]
MANRTLQLPPTPRHLLRMSSAPPEPALTPRSKKALENKQRSVSMIAYHEERRKRLREEAGEDEMLDKPTAIARSLTILEKNNLHFSDLLCHAVHDTTPDWRKKNLFNQSTLLAPMLDIWASNKTPQVPRDAVQRWAIRWVGDRVDKEAAAATDDGFLRMEGRKIDASFAADFNIATLTTWVNKFCPTIVTLLERITITTRQRKTEEQAAARAAATQDTSAPTAALSGQGTSRDAQGVQTTSANTPARGDEDSASVGGSTAASVAGGRVAEGVPPGNAAAGEGGVEPKLSKAQAKRRRRKQAKRDKRQAVIWAVINLLSNRSQKNSYTRHVIGLYLYASGASRQQISVFNHLGLSTSYVTIAGRGNKNIHLKAIGEIDIDVEDQSSTQPTNNMQPLPSEGAQPPPEGQQAADVTNGPAQKKGKKKKKKGRPKDGAERFGTLDYLSLGLRRCTHVVAQTRLCLLVYDNINFMWKIAEQILGRTDSMQNGTASMIMPLHGAEAEDLDVRKLNEHYVAAPEITEKELIPPSLADPIFRQCLIHTILRIVVHYGGEKMAARYRSELAKRLPVTADKIALHKTEMFPLPAWPINEATKSGNAEYVKVACMELGWDEESATRFAKLICGDQLSVARLREVLSARAGNEGGSSGLGWAIFIPGLFHYKMSAVTGFFAVHYGVVNKNVTNPASLASHNTLLQRKPIVLTSLPSFRTCLDLIYVSLTARVLHCFRRISNENDLDKLAEKTDFDGLWHYAEQLLDRYADPHRAADLSDAREETGDAEAGDMVFESAILFMRDGLVLREFSDAIKAGDSGRVYTALKVWTHAYRGSGRPKYAYEGLHFIYMMTHGWPEPAAKIVLNNILINPTGKANSFHPPDLGMEHLIYWIKEYYEAHGSNASWEWLAMVVPCIKALRELATSVHGLLGAKQGDHHATPDLSDDIATLEQSLEENAVYEVRHGRKFDDDDPPPPDIVSKGYAALVNGANCPLKEYNARTAALQQRMTVPPLVGTSFTAAAGNRDETAPPSSPRSSADVPPDARSPGSAHASPIRDERDEQGENDGDADSSPADVINGLTRDLPDDGIQMPTLDREENVTGDLDDDFDASAEPDADGAVSDEEPWTDGESDVEL